MYRLGNSESYDFGLELETAIADAISEVSTFLTPQIVTGEGNDLIHFEWDNLNKNLTTIHGPNFVNSTGGIMIQEKKSGFKQSQARILPEFDRSGKRSFKDNTNEIPLKKLQRNPKFNTTFSALGEDWNIGHKVQNEHEEFTCLMYGDPREKSVNKLHGKILQKMVGGKM